MSRKPPYIRYLLIYLAALLVSAAAVNGLMYLSTISEISVPARNDP